MNRFFLPDLLLAEGSTHSGVGLLAGPDGAVLGVVALKDAAGAEVVPLPGKALLPGLANAHSHSFQRLFRGRAEGRAIGGDSFWSWREQMYRAAGFITPESLYDISRAVFLEMLLSGITVVGEFHYLHNQPSGKPYQNPNQLALEVLRAAESLGIRICLLRTAYLRAGFQREPHPGQRRFYENSESYLQNLESLIADVQDRPQITVGAAPHSIRAVPIEVYREIAAFTQKKNIPRHTHISEQPAENEATLAEYGQTPVALAAANGILSPQTTLVHAIHLTDAEFQQVAAAGSTICSCPTTERNLGDGIFPAGKAARLGIPVCFGTDSQAQIDILEDARQNEYHLRLDQRRRGILDNINGQPLAARLFHSATAAGYRALGIGGGNLAPGEPADFFTVSLDEMAILGLDASSLTEQAVFALGRSAIRDVAVQGKLIIEDGQHKFADEIRSRYKAVQQRFTNGEEK
jgi:formimidoylglutamate deiminase